MAHTFSDIVFFNQGGLNWDDDIIALQPGDARIRRNVTISDDSNFNVFTNMLGNTKPTAKVGGGTFSYPSTVTEPLRVVGFVENKEQKAGIFFVYSDADEHSIIQYYSETNELEYIIDGSVGTNGDILNFPSDGYVDSALIGNEDDLWIIWVNSDNDPMAAPVSGVATVDADDIKLYRKPVMDTINAFFPTTIIEKQNNIRGRSFQFSIRKKFTSDNSRTVLSPFTSVPIPTEEEYPDGIFVSGYRNTSIEVNFDLGTSSDPNLYELCYRINDIGGGAPSQWYVSGTKGVPSGNFLIFDFTYDETGILIPPQQANKVYDYVPDKSDAVTVIDENRIVFAGLTEGYENLDPDNIAIVFNGSQPFMTSCIDGISTRKVIAGSGGSDTIAFTKSTFEDFYYKVVITGAVSATYVYPGSYDITHTVVRDYFDSEIGSLASLSTTPVGADSLTITNNYGSSIDVTLIVFEGSDRKGSFKLGSKLFFGLQYMKDGKPWFVQGNTDPDSSNNLFIHDVPTAADLQGSRPFLNYYYQIDWEIDHLPPQDPDGPTHWQWVYLGDNLDYHEAYLVSRNDSFTHDGNFTIINRNITSNFRKAYGDDINYGFDIQKGDRFRIVGYFDYDYYVSGDIYDAITVYDEDFVIDLEILAVTATEIKIKNIENADFFTAPVTDYLLYCQIYRYKQINLEAGIYQAIYPVNEIIEISGSKYHGSFNGTDQDNLGAPATGTFDDVYYSSCFISYQAFLNENNVGEYTTPGASCAYGFMENHNVSLLYNSNIQQYGKPNIINEYAERRKWNKIRFGGKYLDESGVNFMRSFDFDGERFLDDRNGMIIRLQQIGDTLKAYQERKVTSFYLKTVAGTGADGTQTYVFSNNVMSDARQSVSDYGCSHYGSYVKTVREAYFFDIINAVVIKDTPGGMVPISDFKMHTYFKSKARDILAYTAGTVLISGGWDEDLNMYMLSFYDPENPSDPINETVAFYDRTDRWVVFCDFIPELYGKISGDTALTFLSGELWTQNTNATRCNFFGSQFESVCDVVSKGNPSVIKVFESIEIMSTGEWAPSDDDDIEIEIPDLMQSRLLKGKFKRQEGVYLSEFLRNALDGTGTFQRTRLHNGKILRGYEIRVRLRNDDTTEANLRLVKINSTISQ